VRGCALSSKPSRIRQRRVLFDGQKCTSTSRAIVEDAIYDKFLKALVERTKRLKVGNGLRPVSKLAR
jgi:aldehyde dehydrogenase (NAD+)